jgi:glycosyltransferase involved in cell wall biosynthesis
VSVITPCYNGARFLEGTLRSALQQTLPPVEILVIDDGSTDESAAIAERFGPPVRVIRQPNRGESVARNRGLAEARGSHVLFLDADDLIDPEALRYLAEALAGTHNAVALMGCAWFESNPEQPYTIKEATNREFFPKIIESNFGPPHCWLTPIELVRAAGGFCEPLRWFEDWDLWWRVGMRAGRLIPVPYVGARYRRHPESQLATTNLADRTRGHAAVMTRMIEAFLQRDDLLMRHGDQLFWSSWTSLSRARAEGVPWPELEPLTANVRQLARTGPPAVRQAWLARAIRWVGVRAAMELRRRPSPISS